MNSAAKSVIPTEQLRLRIGELAVRARDGEVTFPVGTRRGSPRYELAPASVVGDQGLTNCVQIGPDEFRRHASDIRALVRLLDIPFAIVIRGWPAAVLRRHPGYEPTAAKKYLAQANVRASVGSPGAHDEARDIDSMLRKLSEHERRIAALETDRAVAPH